MNKILTILLVVLLLLACGKRKEVIEVDERLAADGTCLIDFDEAKARTAAQHAFDQGIKSIS